MKVHYKGKNWGKIETDYGKG